MISNFVRLLGVLAILGLPQAMAETKSQVEIELEKANKRMLARQDKFTSNLKKLESLKVEVQEFKPVVVDSVFKNYKPLPCIKQLKFWPGKDKFHEYKDCLFKYNVTDQKEVMRLYAMFEQMDRDGWEIDREDVEQKNYASTKVINEHQIRFKKLIKNKG